MRGWDEGVKELMFTSCGACAGCARAGAPWASEGAPGEGGGAPALTETVGVVGEGAGALAGWWGDSSERWNFWLKSFSSWFTW